MRKLTAAQIADEEDRTTSFGLLRYAHQYLRASLMVKEQDDESVVPYMLLARSLELALKAFLRSDGATLDYLKRQGHSLPCLYDETIARHLDLVWPEAAELMPALELLDAANHRQGLRYIITGLVHYPDWSASTVLAADLITALIEPCLRGTLSVAGAETALRRRGLDNVFPEPVRRRAE